MAIEIQCPECSGKLRVGDDLLGKKVKCPKCKAIFPAREAEEEEVVDEIEEEEEERPRKRKSRDDDDDRVTERLRKRRRDDDDEDDEDDDRPRRKRRRDDDEDEDDDYDRPRRSAGNPRKELQWARLGTFLMFIGSIVTISAIGLMMLLDILFQTHAWVQQPDWVHLLMVGLPGLGGICTFMTGLVFGILGPKRAPLLGLAIAVVAAGGLHLLFAIICLIPQTQTLGGQAFNFGSQWHRAATSLPVFMEIASHFGFNPLPFFTGLFEVATLVLLYVWLRALMLHYKKSASVGQSIAGICITGGTPILLLLVALILYSIRQSGGMSGTTQQVVYWITFSISYGAVFTVWLFVLLYTLTVNSFLEYQKPK